MKTSKISTRFMNGNLDVENVIFDILCDNYSKKEVFESHKSKYIEISKSI